MIERVAHVDLLEQLLLCEQKHGKRNNRLKKKWKQSKIQLVTSAQLVDVYKQATYSSYVTVM